MPSKKDLLNNRKKVGERVSLRKAIVTDEVKEQKVVESVANVPTQKKTTPKKVEKLPEPEVVPMKKMTIVVTEELHQRLKLYALQNKTSIKDHVVKLIEKSLPKKVTIPSFGFRLILGSFDSYYKKLLRRHHNYTNSRVISRLLFFYRFKKLFVSICIKHS